MIYQKHLTIWQSTLAQISKCLLYERRPEILLIRATSAAGKRMLKSHDHGWTPLEADKRASEDYTVIFSNTESLNVVFQFTT